jgi:uncharacterized protein YyaL (SSP411 family)
MANKIFHPTKETWLTSLRENKPLIFIFQDKLCPSCYSFIKSVLSDVEVRKNLYSHFIPIFLDISHHPDLYERYTNEDPLVHTVQGINGTLLGTCQNISPEEFSRNLNQFNQVYPQVIDPFQNMISIQNFTPLIQEEATKFHEKIELISEITLSSLLTNYDAMYGGWLINNRKYYPSEYLDFLMLLFHRSRDEGIFKIIIQTLRATYRGLFDREKGGFFESTNRAGKSILSYKKGLGNNIAAARTLFQAYQVTNDQYYLEKVQETLLFCFSDLWSQENQLFNLGILAHPIINLSQELFLTRENCDIFSFLLEIEGLVKLPIEKAQLQELYYQKLRTFESIQTDYGIPHILNITDGIDPKFLLQDQSAYLNFLIQGYSYFGNIKLRNQAESFLNTIIEHYYDRKNDLFKDRVASVERDYGPLLKTLFPIQENSFMINNLITLSCMCEKESYKEIATRCVTSYYSNFGISREAPFAPVFVVANQRLIESPIELIIIHKEKHPIISKLLLEMKKIYDPFKIIQILNADFDSSIINEKIREERAFLQTMAFIKVGDTISPPAFYPNEISKMLQTLLEAIKGNI